MFVAVSVKLQLPVFTRPDRVPLSAISLSRSMALGVEICSSTILAHTIFHTCFSIMFVPRKLRNRTKMRPLKAKDYGVQNIY